MGTVYKPSEMGSEFWSPFMHYDSVVFERELGSHFRKFYPMKDAQSASTGNHDTMSHNEDPTLYANHPSDVEDEDESFSEDTVSLGESPVGSNPLLSGLHSHHSNSLTNGIFSLYFVAIAAVLLIYGCWFRQRGCGYGRTKMGYQQIFETAMDIA